MSSPALNFRVAFVIPPQLLVYSFPDGAQPVGGNRRHVVSCAALPSTTTILPRKMSSGVRLVVVPNSSPILPRVSGSNMPVKSASIVSRVLLVSAGRGFSGKKQQGRRRPRRVYFPSRIKRLAARLPFADPSSLCFEF